MANTSKAAANTPYRFVSFIRDSSRAQALDIICFTLTLVPACVNAKSRRDCRECLQLQDGPFETRAPGSMAGLVCFFRPHLHTGRAFPPRKPSPAKQDLPFAPFSQTPQTPTPLQTPSLSPPLY